MKKVVVAGGGFAGAYVAKKLEKDYKVTLIDLKDYYEYTPGITRSIVTQNMRHIQVLHSRYLNHANIITGQLTSVAEHSVHVGKQKIPFDYLVLATGCRYNPTFRQRNVIAIERGRVLRNHHEQLLEAKDVLIIGGGVVGVEMASEIATVFKDKNVILVHSHEELIESFRPKVRTAVTKWLQKHNVNIVYGERIKDIKGKKFTTESGRIIQADIAIACVGNRPNTDYLKHFNEHHDKTCIMVDEYLRLPGTDNIFVGGDVTNIREPKLAQNAERHAKIIVHNIRATEANAKLKKYVTGLRPYIIELSPRHAIFTYKDFVLSGIIPAMMKSFINWNWRRMYS